MVLALRVSSSSLSRVFGTLAISLHRQLRPPEELALLEQVLHLLLGIGPGGQAGGEVLRLLDPHLVVHRGFLQVVRQLEEAGLVGHLKTIVVDINNFQIDSCCCTVALCQPPERPWSCGPGP